VGNVPKNWAEAHLSQIFSPFGTVVELVITRDRFTRMSKGSAFVWFKRAADADKAQMHLNQLVLCSEVRSPGRGLRRGLRACAPLGLAFLRLAGGA
jgi:RNA recognition motif-containing protein